MIFNEALLQSLSPNRFCQSLHKFTAKSRPGTGNAAGLYLVSFGEINWDSMGIVADGEGGECRFHSTENTAVILNILTREQQKNASIILQFWWHDNAAGRTFTSNEHITVEA